MDTYSSKHRPVCSASSDEIQAQVHRSTKKRKRKKNRYRAMSRRVFVLAACCVLALIAVLFLRHYHTHIPSNKKLRSYLDTGTFYNGIVINGKNVSGMTISEARNALSPMINEQAESINIAVSYGSNLWLFTGADMKLSSNLEYVLAQAMLYGRGGTPADNKSAKDELSELGKAFPVVFTADEETLTSRIREIGEALDTPATEPFAEPNIWSDSPGFSYHEGADGHVLDEQALKDSINRALTEGTYQIVIKPELVSQSPTHSMDWLKENTKLRATWQTSFGDSSSLRNANRVGNIQKATTLLNGCCIQVGEEFNFNGFIGPRTESGGWPLAPGIVNGNSYEMQAGGGICQVSTTLYNALLCCGSGIDITERHHHSWPSSYADIGLDSTVTGTVDSGKSLNFINNTGAPLYLFAYCDKENYTMTICIYGEPLDEGVSYKTRGVVVETKEPPEAKTVENINWPTGYKKTTITPRKGYVSEVYLDKYLNGTLQEGQEIHLYTDEYRTVQGETTIGTGDPSLPKPTS